MSVDFHGSIMMFFRDEEKWKLRRTQSLKVKDVLVEKSHMGMLSTGLAHAFICVRCYEGL